MQTHPETGLVSAFTQLELLGFDRVGLVEEITRFASDYGHIVSAKFEADGVRSQGFVRLKLDNNERLESLMIRLKAITGLVKVNLLK